MSYFTETFDAIYEITRSEYSDAGVPFLKTLNKKKRDDIEKMIPMAVSKIQEINDRTHTGAEIYVIGSSKAPQKSGYDIKYNKARNSITIEMIALALGENGWKVASHITGDFNNDQDCVHLLRGYTCNLRAYAIEVNKDSEDGFMKNGTGAFALVVNNI